MAASLPMFMATLDNLVMTTALPVLRTELSASLEQLQWMVNAYTLSFASLMIAAATLGDRWGRRRLFVIGIVVFAAASIASALATSAEALIAARAVQGAGAAAIMPLSLTLLAAAVPPARRAMAIGIWGGVSGLGVALGPVIGGAVVQGISWEAIFWINVPVAIVAIPLVRYALPESFGRRQRIDLTGLVLAASGVLAVVWSVVRGNDDGWGSARVVGGLALGAVLIAAFLLRESPHGPPARPAAPVPRALVRRGERERLRVLPRRVRHRLRALAVPADRARVQPAAGRHPHPAVDRRADDHRPHRGHAGSTARRPPPAQRRSRAAGCRARLAGAWRSPQASAPTRSSVPGLALAGIGMGLTFAPSATAVLADMAPDDHGTASSVNATLREVGGAVGVAVLVAVFQAAGGTLTPEGFADGLAPAALVGAGVVALGAVITLAMPRGTGRATAALRA